MKSLFRNGLLPSVSTGGNRYRDELGGIVVTFDAAPLALCYHFNHDGMSFQEVVFCTTLEVQRAAVQLDVLVCTAHNFECRCAKPVLLPSFHMVCPS